MSTISVVTNPTGKAAEMLGAVKTKLGRVPNMMATMAHSPATLDAYLSFSGALSHSSLSPALREKIALTVSEMNRCDYCLAAHGKFGAMLKLSSEDIEGARRATAKDSKEQAALSFAASVVRNQGKVVPREVEDLRTAGYNDAAVIEIVAVVALNVFTNYFNHVADPEVDFPKLS